jgi:hypothetical protein
VLLVLPSGEGVLTDLTDEQCGELNIQVTDRSLTTAVVVDDDAVRGTSIFSLNV